MTDFKKTHKQLFNSYQKKLAELHETSLNTDLDPTAYFVTYLKLLRDYYLLTSPYSKNIGEEQFELVSLITAISEYEKYTDCVNKYYNIHNGAITRKSGEDAAATLEKYSKERAFHWDAFWNLVKVGLESWVLEC